MHQKRLAARLRPGMLVSLQRTPAGLKGRSRDTARKKDKEKDWRGGAGLSDEPGEAGDKRMEGKGREERNGKERRQGRDKRKEG